MNIRISTFQDNSLKENEIEIIIKSPNINKDVNELSKYIKQYTEKQHRTITVTNDRVAKEINFEDVICFYSDKKYNYCRTKEQSYKIKSKLYEIEKLDPNFIRISKSCIANSKQINFFDLSETAQIIVVFNDDSKEYVSRRKVKNIMEFLDERSV